MRSPHQDVVVRGLYDVSGMRADADLMVWLHAPTAELVQAAVRRIRREGLGERADLVFSGVAMHRPAEFNKGHVPAFMTGAPAQDWLVVYPFVRSYEWYLLPEAGAPRRCSSSTARWAGSTPTCSPTPSRPLPSGTGSGCLRSEGPVLHDIVDLMRHLRSATARRHVREETPFFTGRRVDIAGAIEALR
jgi:peroxiredoxin